MNQAVFVGRLCREVSVRKVSENHRVANNTLAITRAHRDRNGESVSDYIPFVAWDHLADLLNTYTQKGSLISLSGIMQSRNYTNKDNQVVYIVELLVTDITLFDRKTRTPERSAPFVADEVSVPTPDQVPVSAVAPVPVSASTESPAV